MGGGRLGVWACDSTIQSGGTERARFDEDVVILAGEVPLGAVPADATQTRGLFLEHGGISEAAQPIGRLMVRGEVKIAEHHEVVGLVPVMEAVGQGNFTRAGR